MPRTVTAGEAEARLWLQLLLDNESLDKTQQGLKDLAAGIAGMEQASAAASKASGTASDQNLKRLRAEEVQTVHTQSQYRRLQFAARSMGEVFTITAVASTAIFAGAAAWANKYITDAKASTAVVQGWRVKVDQLKTSQSRVGAVLAAELLPLLEKAAELADKGAAFVEAHPDIIKAVLTTAGAVAAISAIGLAVTKGFKIYADIGYIAATYRQVQASAAYASATAVGLEAAKIQMAAATMQVTGVPAAAVAGAAMGPAGAAAAGFAWNAAAGRYISTTTGRFVTAGAATAVATGVPITIGTAALTIGALILGAEAGLIVGNAIAKLIYGAGYEKQGWGDLLTTLVGGWTSIGGAAILALEKIGLSETAAKSAWEVLSRTAEARYTEKAAVAPAVGSIEYVSLFVKQNLQLWVDYNKQITAATESYAKQRVALETNYEKQRNATVASYAKQRAASEASYNLGVSRDWRAYLQSEGDAQRQYYANRIQAVRDNTEQVRRIEQDHQIEMTRDLEDHEIKQRDLLEARDGLAMIREDEQYELERRRKEEDYILELGRIRSETAARLGEMESQFAQERALRRRDFMQRLADNALNHKIEMEQMAANYAESLKQEEADYNEQVRALEESYREQISMLEKAFRERLISLDNAILGDLAAVQAATAKMVASFRAWLIKAAQLNLPAPTGTKAAGGYADYGLYWLGEGRKREFVLNNRSTQIAERAIGGQLSQERILAAMMGGGGRGGRYVDQRTIQFTGVTEADRAAIRRDMYEVSYEVVAEAMKQ